MQDGSWLRGIFSVKLRQKTQPERAGSFGTPGSEAVAGTPSSSPRAVIANQRRNAGVAIRSLEKCRKTKAFQGRGWPLKGLASRRHTSDIGHWFAMTKTDFVDSLRRPRWGLHRPVQKLVDTFILFSRLTEGKTKCKRIPTSVPRRSSQPAPPLIAPFRIPLCRASSEH